ncbi:hypothetical protein O6H91_12G069200 [Diphasiastrum complanatum]|uniref:Uncharacterized protein n=1 Tax=Diphasiastrum complanatum TaxID=34168 RepID=A0ACC2C302_DIPCM|nr:hypothetical protein O6H91_12G069200 [Diphasiastrum complanatum]
MLQLPSLMQGRIKACKQLLSLCNFHFVTKRIGFMLVQNHLFWEAFVPLMTAGAASISTFLKHRKTSKTCVGSRSVEELNSNVSAPFFLSCTSSSLLLLR